MAGCVCPSIMGTTSPRPAISSVAASAYDVQRHKLVTQLRSYVARHSYAYSDAARVTAGQRAKGQG